MALPLLLVVGAAVAVFVGLNIGGSSTGVAFGPATGARVLPKRGAQGLMAVFVLAGAVLIGPHVVETLGTEFVAPEHFTAIASVVVLLFIGLSILVANLFRVSASTSETAVGAVIGMGLALGELRFDTVGVVFTWWFIATMLAFWTSAFVARYLFDGIQEAFRGQERVTSRALSGTVIAVGCYMAFSAGASNAANAVAPLVGSGQVPMLWSVLLGGLAIGGGAFLLGGRTMETVGHEIAELPLSGWVVVSLLAASVITALSWLGIPASLAITMQACVMGFGWGRTTRHIDLARVLGLEPMRQKDRVQREEDRIHTFSVDTTRRIVSMWLLTPMMAGVLAFLTFRGAMWLGLLG